MELHNLLHTFIFYISMLIIVLLKPDYYLYLLNYIYYYLSNHYYLIISLVMFISFFKAIYQDFLIDDFC